MYSYSPLRYPGGKSRLLPLLEAVLEENGLHRCHYAEPFAGGAGLAVGLLHRGMVSEITINDIDRGINSFWHSVVYETADFIKLMWDTPVTVSEWQKQRSIYFGDSPSKLEVGFAAFFLNRTNRSGVIKSGGVLGGRRQTGKYLIDCRYNKINLEERIRKVSDLRSKINVTSMDAVDFISNFESAAIGNRLIYLDPPYFQQGSSLYTNFYQARDHVYLSQKVRTLSCPWLVTYDDTPETRALYAWAKPKSIDILYSLNRKRSEKEILAASPSLGLPGYEQLSPLVA